MAGAGIVESRPGPLGGYRLARPPADITLLDVVLAVDGDGTAFQCREIRQRGPGATDEPGAYRLPCGIARAMWRAEDAWRAELAATTVGDMVVDFVVNASPARVTKGIEWIQTVDITRRHRA
jgi:Rrf2 family protein